MLNYDRFQSNDGNTLAIGSEFDRRRLLLKKDSGLEGAYLKRDASVYLCEGVPPIGGGWLASGGGVSNGEEISRKVSSKVIEVSI